jgi:hypothetical protein
VGLLFLPEMRKTTGYFSTAAVLGIPEDAVTLLLANTNLKWYNKGTKGENVAVKITKSMFINTKLATVLTNHAGDELFTQEFIVNNAPRKANGKTAEKMQCAVQLEQCDITLSKEISSYDRAVQDAVCTMMENGHRYITSEQLARVFSGNRDSGRGISRRRMEKLNEAMEKLANVRATIRYRNDRGHEVEVKNYLIPMKSFRKVKSDAYIYEMMDWPAVYTYAKAHRQVISVPEEIMAIQLKKKDTDDVVIIKRYLIRRIELMKNTNNHVANNCISYDALASELMLDKRVGNVSKKMMEIRAATYQLLDAFVAAGYISSWAEYKKPKAKQFGGVQISMV